MSKKWKTAQVVSIKELSKVVKEIILEIQGVEVFDFVPGQFVTFDLPIGEKRLERWRSYSIVNAPNGNNRIHLIIGYLDGGNASRYFFNDLKEGDLLKLKGPDGMFVLPNELNKDLVMICTGTGVAPFKSMIDHIYSNSITHRGIHLIFGSRTEADMLFRKEFQAIKDAHSEFRYSVALSREEYNDYRGYVHNIYRQHYGDHRDDVLFMLCGWQKMIDEASDHLKEIGYSSQQILFELYG